MSGTQWLLTMAIDKWHSMVRIDSVSDSPFSIPIRVAVTTGDGLHGLSPRVQPHTWPPRCEAQLSWTVSIC